MFRSKMMITLYLLLILAPGQSLWAEIKLTPTPATSTQYVDAMLLLIKKCMGKTPISIKDGKLVIGDEPEGGDNKFADAIRTITKGMDVEIVIGRDIPKVGLGAFKDKDGKTTGKQCVDLDDLQKIPFENECIDTLWAALIHELWEVHYAKENNVGFADAHKEAVKKENEILAEQNPTAHGQRDETCVRENKIISQIKTDADGTANPAGPCQKTVYEEYIGFKKSDGSKAWEVDTKEVVVRIADGFRKSGGQIVKVEVETGTGATKKRVVVTNPDPVVQYFDDNEFQMEFENYPDDPESRPGSFAYDLQNTLYIAEEMKNTIEKRDLDTGDFLGRITHADIQSPMGLAYHFSLGEIFVASANNSKILAFDEEGILTREIQNPELSFPIALALDDGRDDRVTNSFFPDQDTLLFVGDGESNKVLIMDLEGNTLGELSDPELIGPSGIALGPTGLVYVSSFETDQVLIFDRGGNLLDKLADEGLDGPQGIAFAVQGPLVSQVYVAAKNSRSILIFNTDGTVETITHENMVCPKGIAVIERVVSEGVREEVTGEEQPDPINRNYLPHFTYLNGDWNTELTLANGAANEQDVLLYVYDQDGTNQGGRALLLPPGGAFCGTLFDLFPDLPSERGWLDIRSTTDTIRGIINFTLLPTGATTSLTTTNTIGTSLLFPRMDWTSNVVSGFAAVNLASEPQELLLTLTDLEGAFIGEATQQLAAGEKIVALLNALFGENLPEKMVLRIDSEKPITGLGITSRDNGAELIAVPAAVIPN